MSLAKKDMIKYTEAKAKQFFCFYLFINLAGRILANSLDSLRSLQSFNWNKVKMYLQ